MTLIVCFPFSATASSVMLGVVVAQLVIGVSKDPPDEQDGAEGREKFGTPLNKSSIRTAKQSSG